MLAVCPIVMVLGWAAVAAFRAALVEGSLIRSAHAMRSWQGSSLPPPNEWLAAWGDMQDTLRLAPGNPVTLELLGLLAVRRSDDPEVSKLAPSFFEGSLASRPVSPRTWANLAEARYLAGDTSPDFEAALRNAASLGKAEPNVQRIVAHYGLAVWDEVAPDTRAAIEGSLAAGMRRNPLEMLQIAERRGRLTVACPLVPGTLRQPDSRVLRLCPNRETAT